jgi:hypothetical protein
MFDFFKKKKKEAKPAAKSAGSGKATAAVKGDKKAAAKAEQPRAAEKKAELPPTSLKAALAAMEDTIPGATEDKPAPKVSAGANLDKAKEALAKKASAPMDREALIKQALAIQQTQAKMLDKLPEETRHKLRTLALKTFVLDKPTDKKKMN